MTDQPQQPGVPGNSGAWQPVPGGGDYDPDQTMHVSFAAQLPPAPQPGEDPLGAHGPAGDGDAVTQWTIPVIRDDVEAESGEYAVGSFASPWDQAPSPAPTQSFPAGMFSQGAAAAQAAQAQAAAEAQARAARAQAHPQPLPQPLPQPHAEGRRADEVHGGGDTGQFALGGHPDELGAPGPHDTLGGTDLGGLRAEQVRADGLDPLTGQWAMPFSGPESGEAAPWLPAHSPAPDTAWASVVDDPESPPADHPVAAEEAPAPAEDAADDPYPAPDGTERAVDEGAEPASADAPREGDGGELPAVAVLDEFAVPDDEAEPEPEPVEPTHSEHPLASYALRVNGTDRPVTDAWLGESLLYVLRERLGLAGAKDGCEQGECGACSVQVDGRLVASCLVPAATAAGSDVRTVEGLTSEGRPSDVQRALADCGAVQCGFCIPGMAMTVHDLLEGNHAPTDLDVRQALSGNLCRCSGYRGVLDAVRQVVAERGTTEDTAAAEDQTRVPHQGGPNPPGAAV